MQVPPLIQEFLSWRWSPCVALTAGSLAFVTLAVALIPSQIDGEPSASPTLSVVDQRRVPPAAMLNASLAQGPVMTERAAPDQRSLRTRQQPSEAMPPQQQRGFSPVLERAEPAPPPEAPPPPQAALPQAALPQAVPAQAAAAPAPPGVPDTTTPPPPRPDLDGPQREN